MVWQLQVRFLDVIWSSRPVKSRWWWTEQMSFSESREDNWLPCNLSATSQSFSWRYFPRWQNSINYTTTISCLSLVLVQYSFGSTSTKPLFAFIVSWKIILNFFIFNFSISSGRSYDVWKGAVTDNQVWFTNRTSISQSSKVWQSLER